jgi:hypothetical protein
MKSRCCINEAIPREHHNGERIFLGVAMLLCTNMGFITGAPCNAETLPSERNHC